LLSSASNSLTATQAAYLITQGKFFEAFQAAMQAEKLQHFAYKLAVDNLVPDAILRDDLELLRNMFSGFDASAVEGWAMKGQVRMQAQSRCINSQITPALCRLHRSNVSTTDSRNNS
jgi:hypothetical protein